MSTIKARKAGFHDCVDTEDMFIELLQEMQERRYIPRADRRFLSILSLCVTAPALASVRRQVL